MSRRGPAVLPVPVVLLALLGALVTSPARAQAPAPAARPLVVASFYPLYDFARNVAGERAEVLSLVPDGVEPHDWEPSPRDLVQLRKAHLFIVNGAGLEPWADRLARELPASIVLVKATEGLPLVKAPRAGHGHDHARDNGKEHRHDAEPDLDPHVWLDPVLAAMQVERIRDALASVDPAGAPAYAARAAAYLGRLEALDRAFRTGLQECARRDVVVTHAAFGYLANRYRLSMIPVTGISPETEPSPKELAALVRLARRRNVQYIFFETLVNSRVAATLAREVGARTLVLNPVEGLTREQVGTGADYVSLMQENLRNLRTALDCR